jgi:Epoxide hydrolase N terminus
MPAREPPSVRQRTYSVHGSKSFRFQRSTTTVSDASQGLQLATTQALARYWATEYDWRKCEARLNALPQFITEIDGLDIHFIHVRSKHENALPLIVPPWPGWGILR